MITEPGIGALPTSDDPAVQLLVDRIAIHDVQMKYAKGTDRRDWHLLKTVFTENGLTARYREDFTHPKQVVKMITGVLRFHTTYHFMGNQIIDVSGDEAVMRTLSMLTHHFLADGREADFSPGRGQYVDKLRREPQGWVVYDRGERGGHAGAGALPFTGVSGVTTSDPAVQQLLDRAEIYDVLVGYALAVEWGDWERARGYFASEFSFEAGDRTITTGDELVASLRTLERFTFNRDFLGNVLVSVNGDQADSITYAMENHVHQDGLTGVEHFSTSPDVRYADHLVRENGRWVIAERHRRPGRVPADTLPTSDDPALRYVLDRVGIADAIARSAWGVDNRDFDVVRSCFAPDARLTYGDRTATGADAVVAHLQGVATESHRSNHFHGNHLVNIHGDTAEAETYAYVTHQDMPGAPFSLWVNGGLRFDDTLARIDGRWVIKERVRATNLTDAPGHSLRSPLKDPY